MIRALFLVFLACALAAPLSARDSLTVNAGSLGANTPALGMNLNYLMDAPLTAGQLAATGARALRYPGGEKSDTYLWSVPPYDAPHPTLARTGPQEWPSGDRSLVNADGSFVNSPLDFDSFLALAQTTGAIPIVVVPFDSAFKAATSGGTAPSYEQLKQNAVAWVRYAAGRVRYWEIGNESYHPQANGNPTAAEYAAGVNDFAAAMKQVDPTIQIGANGNPADWWQTVLSQAGSSVDFLSVHNYPLWSITSYAQYRDSSASLVAAVDRARAAAAGRPLLITESGALTSSAWAPTADLGHAIMLADVLIAQAAAKGVAVNLMWTSRWVSAPDGPRSYDALDAAGNLTPAGRAQALLSQAMRGRVAVSTGSSKVHVFATKDGGVLRIVLLNKHTSRRDVALTVKSAPAATATRQQFGGTTPGDLAPATQTRSSVRLSSGAVNLTLDPVSITILTFQ